ncbi:PadR family transcriptional regulator [Krasilnikoviella flava]|uniref:Transcriptional regulator, PadR family n=1 Tax=Krasilnikoviella flava TaxID=526729 RepID=A0A1T5IFB1_9MICO|nr:PadR family transcriptional regulator [Krasilnikoviella flava]SKC37829.1 transcriptional regulator, PadR family [Krasilnikoviella flava]
MSVRQGFLALLSERPMHGYQLRQEFEARTGGTWPLNIGQAYTTLQRLQRDGLVAPVPDDDEGPERFRLTDAGRAEADAWWLRPVERRAPARDELAIKLALAVTVQPEGHGVDVAAVVQHQRTESLRALRDYTLLKRDAGDDPDGLAWSLVLDSLVFAVEAEVRWLDHVESTVAQAAARRDTPPVTEPVEPAPSDARRSGPDQLARRVRGGAR